MLNPRSDEAKKFGPRLEFLCMSAWKLFREKRTLILVRKVKATGHFDVITYLIYQKYLPARRFVN
jgi:hypothetical protein